MAGAGVGRRRVRVEDENAGEDQSERPHVPCQGVRVSARLGKERTDPKQLCGRPSRQDLATHGI